MTQLNIRPAMVEDAQGIATVHVESWQHAYVGQISAAHLRSLSIEARARRWQEILRDPGQSQLLVAEDQEIVGFCGFGPCRDADATPGTGEVYALYVAPAHLCQGVGSALFVAGTAALGQLGYERMSLWVLATNAAAQAFYRRHGFMPDCARKIDSIGGADVVEVRYVCEDARLP